MRTSPIPLVGGAYSDESRPWTQQDTCNYLPCRAERSGTRSPEKLKTPPGLRPFVEIPDTVPPEWTPVRGTHNCEGRLFAVIGQTLYQITSAGVAIPRGTVPGYGRVSMEHNQISLGNELTIVNGSAGYVYNTVTGVFGRITDAGYPGSATVKFIDSYMIGIEPQGRYAFNSDPANATSFNTLDRFTSEVRPDPLVAMAVSNNELVLFSAESAEFFYNSGAAQQPFRTKRITMDKGAAGPYVVAEADNTVFWLSSDGSFFQLQGYTPARISTRPIEQAINGLDWTKAYAFVWEDAGHTVVYWTFPDGRTWGWDVSQQEWHRRESYGLDRWRVSSMTRWNNRWVAGDFQKGRLWYVDWDYVLEGDQEFISSRTLAVIHDNQNLVRVPRLELVMDTGQPETAVQTFPSQPNPPTITGDAPDASEGDAYSYSYTLGSGTPPYVVTLLSGVLPAGLTLSTAGTISGTPTSVESQTFTVRVTDSTGLYDDLEDTIASLYDIRWDSTPGEFQDAGTAAFQNNDFRIYALQTGGVTGAMRAQSVAALSGKRYFELEIYNSDVAAAGRFYSGTHFENQGSWPSITSNRITLNAQETDGTGNVFIGPATNDPTASLDFTSGTFGTARIRFAVDVPNRKVWVGVGASGAWVDGDPAAGTGGYTAAGVNPIYVYGDLNNTTTDKERRIEIVSPASWDFTAPTGFV